MRASFGPNVVKKHREIRFFFTSESRELEGLPNILLVQHYLSYINRTFLYISSYLFLSMMNLIYQVRNISFLCPKYLGEIIYVKNVFLLYIARDINYDIN